MTTPREADVLVYASGYADAMRRHHAAVHALVAAEECGDSPASCTDLDERVSTASAQLDMAERELLVAALHANGWSLTDAEAAV